KRALRASRIRGGRLMYRGAELTSERLKFEIEAACLKAGAVSRATIVASGEHALMPHDCGKGPIRPNQLVIVDVFPRGSASGYYGDMTRTFLRGRPSDAQRKLVATVKEAQDMAMQAMRSGVPLSTPHRVAAGVFKARGYDISPGREG